MPGVSELTREDEERRVLWVHDAVEEFIEAYDAEEAPWEKLIEEESEEVLEAVANFIKEAVDLGYVMTGYELANDRLPREPAFPSWVKDMWEAVPQHIQLEALNRVHASNMSKLGPDGKPIRREDGKVLKGPNYKPADLSDLVRQ